METSFLVYPHPLNAPVTYPLHYLGASTGVAPASLWVKTRATCLFAHEAMDIEKAMEIAQRLSCTTYTLHVSFGSLDGSCTRFSLTENQSDLSIRPRGCAGVVRVDGLASHKDSKRGATYNHVG